METITERAVKLCFPLEKLQKIVCRILKKNEIKKEDEKVPSLEFLAIKTTMRRRMKEDLNAKILCQLVLKELVYISYFEEGAVFGNAFRHFQKRGIDPSPVFATLRQDPQVMLAVLRQRQPSTCGLFILSMFKNSFQVAIDGRCIAEIPRDGYPDMAWAMEFGQLAFWKYYPMAIIEWKKEFHEQWEDLRVETHMEQLLAICGHIFAPEYWDLFRQGQLTGQGEEIYNHGEIFQNDTTYRFLFGSDQ